MPMPNPMTVQTHRARPISTHEQMQIRAEKFRNRLLVVLHMPSSQDPEGLRFNMIEAFGKADTNRFGEIATRVMEDRMQPAQRTLM